MNRSNNRLWGLAAAALLCSLSGAATQPVTFDSRGLVTDNAPTVTIASGNGQTWTLQILLSGLVLLNAQTSS